LYTSSFLSLSYLDASCSAVNSMFIKVKVKWITHFLLQFLHSEKEAKKVDKQRKLKKKKSVVMQQDKNPTKGKENINYIAVFFFSW
jgi:hypothetical protein